MIDSTQLNKKIRTFDVISVRSGNSVTLRDDGAAINTDGTHPNCNRQHCILQATKRHTHGGKGSNGPSIASFVTPERLERSTGDGKYDPATQFKSLDDTEVIDGKPMTYRQIIAANVEVEHERRRADAKLALGEARSRGADKEFLDRLENIVKGVLEGAVANAAATNTEKSTSTSKKDG